MYKYCQISVIITYMCENTTNNIRMYRKYTNPVTTNTDKIH